MANASARTTALMPSSGMRILTMLTTFSDRKSVMSSVSSMSFDWQFPATYAAIPFLVILFSPL